MRDSLPVVRLRGADEPAHRGRRPSTSAASRLARAGALAAALTSLYCSPALASAGSLSEAGSVPAGPGVARIAISPNGLNAYATNRFSTTVSEYSRDPATGALTPLASIEAGASPEGIVVSSDGRFVYVANKGSNTVSEFRVQAGGELSRSGSVPAGEGPIGVAASPPHQAQDLYVTDSVSGEVTEFGRNVATGALTEIGTASAGANVHGIVISPDGANVYTANYGSGTVSELARDETTGRLSPLSVPAVAAGVNPHGIAISPEGNSVYVADSAESGEVVVFSREAATGALTRGAEYPAGAFTECVAVSPNGRYLYATSYTTDTIAQFSREGASGLLAPLTPPTVATAANPEGIAISPDGRSVYTADNGAEEVSEYAVEGKGGLHEATGEEGGSPGERGDGHGFGGGQHHGHGGPGDGGHGEGGGHSGHGGGGDHGHSGLDGHIGVAAGYRHGAVHGH